MPRGRLQDRWPASGKCGAVSLSPTAPAMQDGIPTDSAGASPAQEGGETQQRADGKVEQVQHGHLPFAGAHEYARGAFSIGDAVQAAPTNPATDKTEVVSTQMIIETRRPIVNRMSFQILSPAKHEIPSLTLVKEYLVRGVDRAGTCGSRHDTRRRFPSSALKRLLSESSPSQLGCVSSEAATARTAAVRSSSIRAASLVRCQ